jgi:hypothetical protein
LATKDGRIVLENTLDARLEVVFKQQLPEVSLNSTGSVGLYLVCLLVKLAECFMLLGITTKYSLIGEIAGSGWCHNI